MKKGFTLIELLVVMAIMAILMAAVVVGVDPLDKIESAKDAKVMQDVSTISGAMEAYAAGHAGAYPCTAGVFNSADVIASGELKAIPTAPSGRTYVYTPLCTATNGSIAVQVTSKKFVSDTKSPFYIPNTGTVYWVWCASSGKAGSMASIACP